MYSMDTDFGLGAPSFFVEEALLSSKFGERLAWEASDINVDSAFWVDMGVLPRVISYLERGEIVPDERSGLGSRFRGTNEDVGNAKGVEGLGGGLRTGEICDNFNDVKINFT